jgi:S1-C subfamily serine protease
MPDAPTVIAGLGHLVNPNGFPQVFLGPEPRPPRDINLPSLGDLQPAVQKAQDSVVKIAGQGCGGIVEGTGFVAGKGLVVTNAHVVAGIQHPYLQDRNGNHRATIINFDPDLDIAILHTDNLTGKSLTLNPRTFESGTPAAVLGYPEGGPLTARPAAVLTMLLASGRNIYGRGDSVRQVYEVQTEVLPGNSGGPLLAEDGSVIGVIFAESTSYKHIGYALTSPQVLPNLTQASHSMREVSSGRCAK